MDPLQADPGFWRSTSFFLKGVLRRWYFWAFAILLDPFEIHNRFLKNGLPFEWQKDIELPSQLGLFLLIVLLLWAGACTFHELRKQAIQDRGEATNEKARVARERDVALNKCADLRREIDERTAERDRARQQLDKPNLVVESVRKRINQFAHKLRGLKIEHKPTAKTERIDQIVNEDVGRELKRMLVDRVGFHHAGNDVHSRRKQLRDEWLEARALWLDDKANNLTEEDIEPDYLLAQMQAR